MNNSPPSSARSGANDGGVTAGADHVHKPAAESHIPASGGPPTDRATEGQRLPFVCLLWARWATPSLPARLATRELAGNWANNGSERPGGARGTPPIVIGVELPVGIRGLTYAEVDWWPKPPALDGAEPTPAAVLEEGWLPNLICRAHLSSATPLPCWLFTWATASRETITVGPGEPLDVLTGAATKVQISNFAAAAFAESGERLL